MTTPLTKDGFNNLFPGLYSHRMESEGKLKVMRAHWVQGDVWDWIEKYAQQRVDEELLKQIR